MDRYKVEYFKHSLIDDLKRVSEEVDKVELIALLNNGMVTVNNVQRIIETDYIPVAEGELNGL